MAIQLPNDLAALVERRLASGAYADAEDVVRRALEAFDAAETWPDEERQALDAKIDRAMAQMAHGEGIPGGEARARLRERKSAWMKDNPSIPS